MQFNPWPGECDGLTGRAQGLDPISLIAAIIPFSNAVAVPSEGFSPISSLQSEGNSRCVWGWDLWHSLDLLPEPRCSQRKRKRLLGEVPCQRGRPCFSLLIILSWKSISWHRLPSNLLVAMETAQGARGEKYSLVRKSPNFVLPHF